MISTCLSVCLTHLFQPRVAVFGDDAQNASTDQGIWRIPFLKDLFSSIDPLRVTMNPNYLNAYPE
jgi:hypothetical protein